MEILEFNNNWINQTFEIKKSKFISYAFSVNSIDKFNKIYEILKNKYSKANHICYAYNFSENGLQKTKYFDANEPKGTAGMPILNVINKNNKNNIVIFVIRFFGGIKLGSGVLFRSYLKSAALAINNVINSE